MPSGSDFRQITKDTGVEAAADGAGGDLDICVAEKRPKRLKYVRYAVVGTKFSALAVLVAILLGQASHTKESRHSKCSAFIFSTLDFQNPETFHVYYS